MFMNAIKEPNTLKENPVTTFNTHFLLKKPLVLSKKGYLLKTRAQYLNFCRVITIFSLKKKDNVVHYEKKSKT